MYNQLSVLFISCWLLGSAALAQQRSPLPPTARQGVVQREALATWAAARQVSLREALPDGRVRELVAVDKNGNPHWYITTNLNAARTSGTDSLRTGGGLGLSLSGAGLTVGVWDEGIARLTHNELAGRTTAADSGSTNSGHATHVAGTVGGGGANPSAMGMAPAATLRSYDWNDDRNEALAASANEAMLVSNHSYTTMMGWQAEGGIWKWYGVPSVSETEDYRFGSYNWLAQWWDYIVYVRPYYLPVWAAGNDRNDEGPAPGGTHQVWNGGAWVNSTLTRQPDGGYDCLPPETTAKNMLTVGAIRGLGKNNPEAITNFSNWGPTDDGRIKPDLVAKGYGVFSSYKLGDNSYALLNGTSMATPTVSGSLLLLQEHYGNLHDGQHLRAASLKGLALHTADDIETPGPDYRSGWGVLNAARAARFLTDDTAEATFLGERVLPNGQDHQYAFRATGAPLRATISWADPYGPTASPAAVDNPTLRLVNDLDLRVDQHQPYVLDPAQPDGAATQGDNFRDNVEQVLIANPVPGRVYTVRVSHKENLAFGAQAYTLLLSGATPEPTFAARPVGFVGQPLAFRDLTPTRGGAGVSAWNLDADDQTEAFASAFSYTFDTPGTYPVTMTTPTGLSVTKSVRIMPAPVVPYQANFADIGAGFYPTVLQTNDPAAGGWTWLTSDTTKPNLGTAVPLANGTTGFWSTSPAGTGYGAGVRAVLETPAFDLPATGELYLHLSYQAYVASDAGLQVQFSNDDGTSWRVLGYLDAGAPDPNATNEWYNAASVPGLDGTAGWQRADAQVRTPTYSLGDLRGERVLFRLVFGAQQAGTDGFRVLGFAITDSEDSPLPVVWRTYEATAEGDYVRLRWETAQEQNNAGFHVELKEEPAADFRTVGFVRGAGDSDVLQTYAFRAGPLAPGRYVCRLRQEDFDGQIDYSEARIVTVGRTPSAALQLYPNPVVKNGQVRFYTSGAQRTTVRIFNALGQAVYTTAYAAEGAGWHTLSVDATRWAPGLYGCTVTGAESAETVWWRKQ